MTTLDVGAGVREAADRPAAGSVVATFRAACYLRFPAGLLALTTAAAPPGPLHLRVRRLPVLRPGDAAYLDVSSLSGRGDTTWSVDLDAPTWTGALPPAGRPRSLSPARVRALAGLAARIGGRGPGLTPAGDDVLAGVLLATRAGHDAAIEPELLAVARSVNTTEIATAFLSWAARGQCIEPAHAWLAATVAEDTGGCARAAAGLRRVGATSGQALLDGLAMGWAGDGAQSPGGVQPPDSAIHTALAGSGPGLVQQYGRSVG